MSVIVSNISLPFTAPAQEALLAARKRLGLSAQQPLSVVRRGIDARHKNDIRFVYSVAADLGSPEEEEKLAAGLHDQQIRVYRPAALELEPSGMPLASRPVIVGFGPAGMFAGLILARAGYRPIILERGDDVDRRTGKVRAFWQGGGLSPETNVQFGEGGAGTFSDGKLNTRISDERCRYVLEELVRHGAPEEILWQAKPHVGTDRLRGVVKAIRQEIIAMGGEIRFAEKLCDLKLQNGRIRAAVTDKEELAADALLLAPGHSARDTFAMLLDRGVQLVPKPFSVGVRIEHLQADIDGALYGGFAGHPLLPPGEYQLSHREGQRAVYTFCMCPGGMVVAAASEEGGLVTNGMSELARNRANANAALVVSVGPEDFGSGVFDGIRFQRGLEQAAFASGGGAYAAPAQTVGAFRGKPTPFSSVMPSYPNGVKEYDLARLFPEWIGRMLDDGLARFGRKLRGFDAPEAVMTGVETRTSSPVRIVRGQDYQAVGIEGLYPCGEGAGYAGGIMSSAVDGIASAQALIANHTPAS